MKYFTLALIMVAPCLAQASQYLTGILSINHEGRHYIKEVATDLPNCQTVEDVQANPEKCFEGRTIQVIIPELGEPVGEHDALEAELQRLSGSLVRLTGTFDPFFSPHVLFTLSLHDTIETIAAPQASDPEPCYNYNGVCH
jgi:hypothetical protein